MLPLTVGQETLGRSHCGTKLTRNPGTSCEVTRDCLKAVLQLLFLVLAFGDAGHAVQKLAEDNGYGVLVILLVMVLPNLHEDPRSIGNHGRAGNGIVLREGMVIRNLSP